MSHLARRDRVQTERGDFFHQLQTFCAGIYPQFLAALLGDVVEHFHTDGRWQVAADAFEYDPHIESGFESLSRSVLDTMWESQ